MKRFPDFSATGSSAREFHVWYADLNPESSRLDYLNGLLSPAEQNRAKRFKFWRDQRRFIVGRAMLRLLIGRYLLTEAKQIKFSYNKYGKPFLASNQLRFNLAHCRDKIIFAFCLSVDIGVDLECLRTIEDVPGIASQFFSANESEAILNSPLECQSQVFLTYWTLKEAYIKAIGQGLSYPLDSFEVVISEDKELHNVTRREGVSEESTWSLFSFAPDPDCVAAAAVRGNDWRLKTHNFEL